MLLTWLRKGSSMRSGVRGGECGKVAAVRAAMKDGELEAAARQSGAGRRRQRQRGSGRRGVGGGSAAPEGGEKAAARLWS